MQTATAQKVIYCIRYTLQSISYVTYICSLPPFKHYIEPVNESINITEEVNMSQGNGICIRMPVHKNNSTIFLRIMCSQFNSYIWISNTTVLSHAGQTGYRACPALCFS